ncbi:hypothetical protein C0J52_05664 [Blattella germanica]|nr:hypothetical protein C0J52_05664 [Blattella germanica]
MWILALLLVGLPLTESSSSSQICPAVCDCYYSQINFVADCSGIDLEEIPMKNLSRAVRILDLNCNKITEIPRFPMHFQLKELKLAHNGLTSLGRDTLYGLTFLVAADFSNNQLTYVHPEAFRQIPFPARNPLELVNGPFLSTRTLLHLDISHCNLTELSPFFFINTATLRKLDLSGNPIAKIEPDVFSPLVYLTELNISNCQLTTMPNFVFGILRNIKALDMSENNLHRVNWQTLLKNFRRLRHLNLRNAHITKLPRYMFFHNERLNSVILAGNSITRFHIETMLGRLRYLKHVDLTDCKLQTPLSVNMFIRARSIRTLILSGNLLSGKNLAYSLRRLIRLEKLHVRNCGLTRLPKRTFDTLRSLQELDISHNHLRNVDTRVISSLESLTSLDLSYNNLTNIPHDTFWNNQLLTDLILSGNKLEYLQPGLFKDLDELTTLEINDCGLVRPPGEETFKSSVYEHLEELHMSGNDFSTMGSAIFFPYQLRNVKLVDISSCKITRLAKTAFKNTPHIHTLNLSGNTFSGKLRVDFLKWTKSIEEIDLRHCKMTRLSPKIFHHAPNIVSLKLSGNPWKCGCYIKDLWEQSNAMNNENNHYFTADSEDFIAGSEGGLENIFCYYNITRKSERKWALFNLNGHFIAEVSWAKYIRESNCVSARRKLRRTYGKSKYGRVNGSLE